MHTNVKFKIKETDNQLLFELRHMVRSRVKSLSRKRKESKKLWAIILPVFFIGLYLLALVNKEFQLLYFFIYGLMGIVVVVIFINLIHDAVHNNVYELKAANQRLLFLFDLLGGNSYIWKKRHILMHHNFQNVAGWDSDIEQAGLIKIYPQDKTTRFHRYQHLLVFFFYPLFLLNWVLVRDFRDFFEQNRLVRKVCDIPFIEYAKLFLFKAVFLGYMLFLPISLGTPVIQSILGVLIFLVSGSIFAMLSLLTPHANIESSFPKLSATGEIEDSWLRHQFLSTNDLSINNWFTRQVLGNFNFHIAHHLFPNISSVYYPEITEVIKDFAQKNNLKYRSYSIPEALKNHYKLIRMNANDFDLFEEDM